MAHTAFKDWPILAAKLVPAVRELYKASPGVMKAFRGMGVAAHEGGALDPKTKELLAIAISVTVRCHPCITFHTEGARKHGATPEENAETVGLAVNMGAGPRAMYAAQVLEADDQYASKAAG